MDGLTAFGERVLTLGTTLAPALIIAPILYVAGAGRIPPPVALLGLVAGAFATFGSLAAGIPFLIASGGELTELPTAVRAFAGAGLCEEGAKLALLLTMVLRHHEADRRRDAIVAGAWLGLGFALVENFFVVTMSPEWLVVAGIRLSVAVPCHVQLGLIMGWLVGMREPQSRFALGGALLLPAALHGLYDWPLLTLADISDPDDATFFGYFAIAMVAVLSIAVLVGGPVARAIAAIPRRPVAATVRHRIVTILARVLAWAVLIGGPLGMAAAMVAAAVLGPVHVLLVPLAVFPIAFGVLWWRTARTEPAAIPRQP